MTSDCIICGVDMIRVIAVLWLLCGAGTLAKFRKNIQRQSYEVVDKLISRQIAITKIWPAYLILTIMALIFWPGIWGVRLKEYVENKRKHSTD